MAPRIRYTVASANGLITRFLDNIFRVLSPEAGLYDLSPDATIVQTHQHSAGAKKGAPNGIGHSRGGASSKIHISVDAYGYPIYLMLSEGQRNDINFAIPVLEHINIEGNSVPADRGYDSRNLIDYIYENDGKPAIRPKKESNLRDTVTGGCIWNAILLSNIFSN